VISTIIALTLSLTLLIEIAGALFAPILAFFVPNYLDLKLAYSGSHTSSKFDVAISISILVISFSLSISGIISLFFAQGQPD